MNRSNAPPLALVRAPLRAFVEVPLTAESPFTSVEIQQLESGDSASDHGTGILVKLQRRSGDVDIYYEPHLGLNAEWFHADPGFAHMSLGSLQPTEFDELSFRVEALVTDVSVSFTERNGQTVRILVRHHAKRPARSMFVPATPQSHPTTLRLLLLETFRLIPRRASTVAVEVDGTPMRARPFLLPERLAGHWSARAASGIVMASCNGDSDGVGHPRVGADRNWLEVLMVSDPAPGLEAHTAGLQTGTFQIDSPLGIVTSGSWSIKPDAEEYDVLLSGVRQDWFPGWSRPAVLMLWSARRIRRRNQPWAWRGRLRNEGDRWHRNGSWTIDR